MEKLRVLYVCAYHRYAIEEYRSAVYDMWRYESDLKFQNQYLEIETPEQIIRFASIEGLIWDIRGTNLDIVYFDDCFPEMKLIDELRIRLRYTDGFMEVI